MRCKIFIFLFSPFITFGQGVYTGKILNSKTKEPVPYAIIMLTNKKIGTNSDEAGNFQLKLNTEIIDSLVITCTGYEPLALPIKNLPQDGIFEMTAKFERLKEVIVSNNTYKKKEILNKSTGHWNHSYCLVPRSETTSMAQPFYTPVSNCLLKEVVINKIPGEYTFRLKIYDIDSLTKHPSVSLCDTIIEVNSSKKHAKINLEQYNIIIPSKEFFIAVEWLRRPDNESTKYYSRGSKQAYYGPEIYLSDPNEIVPIEETLWFKDYSGKWQRSAFLKYRLRISATVLY